MHSGWGCAVRILCWVLVCNVVSAHFRIVHPKSRRSVLEDELVDAEPNIEEPQVAPKTLETTPDDQFWGDFSFFDNEDLAASDADVLTAQEDSIFVDQPSAVDELEERIDLIKSSSILASLEVEDELNMQDDQDRPKSVKKRQAVMIRRPATQRRQAPAMMAGSRPVRRVQIAQTQPQPTTVRPVQISTSPSATQSTPASAAPARLAQVPPGTTAKPQVPVQSTNRTANETKQAPKNATMPTPNQIKIIQDPKQTQANPGTPKTPVSAMVTPSRALQTNSTPPAMIPTVPPRPPQQPNQPVPGQPNPPNRSITSQNAPVPSQNAGQGATTVKIPQQQPQQLLTSTANPITRTPVPEAQRASQMVPGVPQPTNSKITPTLPPLKPVAPANPQPMMQQPQQMKTSEPMVNQMTQPTQPTPTNQPPKPVAPASSPVQPMMQQPQQMKTSEPMGNHPMQPTQPTPTNQPPKPVLTNSQPMMQPNPQVPQSSKLTQTNQPPQAAQQPPKPLEIQQSQLKPVQTPIPPSQTVQQPVKAAAQTQQPQPVPGTANLGTSQQRQPQPQPTGSIQTQPRPVDAQVSNPPTSQTQPVPQQPKPTQPTQPAQQGLQLIKLTAGQNPTMQIIKSPQSEPAMQMRPVGSVQPSSPSAQPPTNSGSAMMQQPLSPQVIRQNPEGTKQNQPQMVPLQLQREPMAPHLQREPVNLSPQQPVQQMIPVRLPLPPPSAPQNLMFPVRMQQPQPVRK